jgi:hypothetical protein
MIRLTANCTQGTGMAYGFRRLNTTALCRPVASSQPPRPSSLNFASQATAAASGSWSPLTTLIRLTTRYYQTPDATPPSRIAWPGASEYDRTAVKGMAAVTSSRLRRMVLTQCVVGRRRIPRRLDLVSHVGTRLKRPSLESSVGSDPLSGFTSEYFGR